MIISDKLGQMGEEGKFRTKAQKYLSVPWTRFEPTIRSVTCWVLKTRSRGEERDSRLCVSVSQYDTLQGIIISRRAGVCSNYQLKDAYVTWPKVIRRAIKSFS
jgi:hypothetical protein